MNQNETTAKKNIPGYIIQGDRMLAPRHRVVQLLQAMALPAPYVFSPGEQHWTSAVEAAYQKLKPVALEQLRSAMGYGASPLQTYEEDEAKRFLIIWMSINHESSWLQRIDIEGEEAAHEKFMRQAKEANAVVYTQCKHCYHFVDEDLGHLEDGEQEFNHDPEPNTATTKTLGEWKKQTPELFLKFSDGNIGPNSIHFNRKGKE